MHAHTHMPVIHSKAFSCCKAPEEAVYVISNFSVFAQEKSAHRSLLLCAENHNMQNDGINTELKYKPVGYAF